MEEIVFICVVAIVVLTINLVSVKKKNKELNMRISRLENRQSDLLGKAYYNYLQIKGINYKFGLTEEENRKVAETIRSPVVGDRENVHVNNPVNTPTVNKESTAAVNYGVPVNNPVNTPTVNKEPAAAINYGVTVNDPVNVPTVNKEPAAAVNYGVPVNDTVNVQSVNKESTAAVNYGVTVNDPVNVPTVNKEPAAAVNYDVPVNNTVNTAPIQNESLDEIINVNPYTGQPVQTTYCRYSSAQKTTKPPHDSKKFESMTIEHWLGTRLFNIVASVMIFIGLILFCMLGYEYISDGMKIAAMYIVSLGFVGIGGYITKKNRSVFSLGLTGCGMGSFFISILLTHIYFDAINDITAFSLIFVWIILALFLSKKLDSLMLSITAHIGMAISVCFAFSMGFSSDRIILPIIYQLACIALIIIGNIICCKKTYRFGLLLSMVLLVYSSIVISDVLGKSGIVPFEVSTALIIIVFAAQFIALSFVSYLIAVSSNNLAITIKENYNNPALIIHIVNKALWSIGVIATVGSAAYIICRSCYSITNLVYPSIAIFAVTVCHMLVTLFLSEKLDFNEKLSKISLYYISGFVTISLFVQATQRTVLHGMPLLFIYTGLVMIIGRYTRNKKLNHLISMLIGAEMIYVCLYGYSALSNVVISVLYMLMLGFMLLLHWFGQSEESRQRRFSLFKLAEFLWICASVIPINVSQFSGISLPLIISEFSLLAIIAYLTGYAGENDFILNIIVKAEAFVTMFAGAALLCGAQDGALGDILIIKIIYFIMTLSLFVVYCYDLALSNSAVVQLISAASLSAYITAFCIGYSDKFAFAFVYTNVLKCMPFFFITALGAFVIYMLNKNTKLSFALLIPLFIDMFYMLISGYNSLSMEVNIESNAVRFDIKFIAILHFIIVSVMMYLLWHTQPKSYDRKKYVMTMKGIFYYRSMISILVLNGIYSVSNQAGSGYPLSFGIVFVMIINIAAIWFGLAKDRTLGKDNVMSGKLENVVNITACIILYIGMIFIGMKIQKSQYASLEYSIRFAQIVMAAGLLYVLARNILKNGSIVSHLFICFTATVFVNVVCRGIPVFSQVMYIYSIVSMAVALICIIAGFISKSKGMRMYGLILIMLCVLKLVTIDIVSDNSMSRVLAFIVGGMVCFIISGIYNIFEKKFSERHEITENIE